jgi:hypothetical protein
VQEFRAAARDLAAAGIDTVFVGPEPAVAEPAVGPGLAGHAAADGAEPAGPPPLGSRLRTAGVLRQSDLAELMRGARLIITNGGSTLLQSIACGRPCIAVPIAGDQPRRIRRCVCAGVAIAAQLDAAAICECAIGVLRDERVSEGLARRAIALGLNDGVDVALGALSALVPACPVALK